MSWLGDAWGSVFQPHPLAASRLLDGRARRRVSRRVTHGRAADTPDEARYALLLIRRRRHLTARGRWAALIGVAFAVVCAWLVLREWRNQNVPAAVVFGAMGVWWLTVAWRGPGRPDRSAAAEAANRELAETAPDPSWPTGVLDTTPAQQAVGVVLWFGVFLAIGGALSWLTDGGSWSSILFEDAVPTAVGGTIGALIAGRYDAERSAGRTAAQ